MNITSKDIAKACGVSRGSVDRALNNRSGISEETKQLILETAEKLGYKPHFLASSLARGKTMTIGLVVFDVYNRFFAQLIDAIEKKARERGYFLYLTLTYSKGALEKDCIEHLVQRQVDGIILCSAVNDSDYTAYLKGLNIPVVTIGNRVSPDFSFVGIDDFKAMYDAALSIIHKNYTHIYYVSPPLAKEAQSNIHAQKQRYLGFLDAIKGYDAIGHTVLSDHAFLDRIETLILQHQGKNAILCSSDVYALEALNHLRGKGFAIPEDAGIMGFDNIDTLRFVNPRLNTVSYPTEEIGAKAVEILSELINGQKASGSILFQHRIIEGQSL